jgi:hypothetical protein
VPVEQDSPLPVAECSGLFGRVDNIGEHDGRQHSIRLGISAKSGQKLLDFIDDAIRNLALKVRSVIGSGQLHQFRSRECGSPNTVPHRW